MIQNTVVHRLGGMDIDLRCGARRGAGFAHNRFVEKGPHHEDREPLNQPENQEGATIAARLNHAGERDYGCGSAQSVAHRDQARRKTASIRKPLECRADAGPEDAAHPDAADDGSRVKPAEGLRVRIHHPGGGRA